MKSLLLLSDDSRLIEARTRWLFEPEGGNFKSKLGNVEAFLGILEDDGSTPSISTNTSRLCFIVRDVSIYSKQAE